MNPADLHPIVQQAERNSAYHREWVLLHPAKVLELIAAYESAEAQRVALLDAYLEKEEQQEQIRALASAVLYDCAGCYREDEGRRVHEIERLASA